MTRQRRLAVGLVASLASVAACDPGWGYHVQYPRSAGNQDTKVTSQVTSNDGQRIALTAHGTLFTGSLWIDVYITNEDPIPLAVRPDTFRVLDVAQRPLTWKERQIEAHRCSNHNEETVVLLRGETCMLHGGFDVDPGGFFSRNADLKRLTVVVEEVARGETPLPQSLVLEWDQ